MTAITTSRLVLSVKIVYDWNILATYTTVMSIHTKTCSEAYLAARLSDSRSDEMLDMENAFFFWHDP